jgi:molybdate transport system ATP-binding protein
VIIKFRLIRISEQTLLTKPEDIPEYVDEVIYSTQKELFHSNPQSLSYKKKKELLNLQTPIHTSTSNLVVKMKDVGIRYGNRQILENVNWEIHEGECWSLSGSNGSGKSTLLSLIAADNPQAYACDITLFGNQRGSGETIWDIKRRIGYVSPEMHRAYKHNLPALQVVASGLKDTIGLYVRPNEAEREQCMWWMRLFGIEELATRSFMMMSSGEQRMVLLARAFVKDPELLILDEPMHGLDLHNQQLVKDIIETFCQIVGRIFKFFIFLKYIAYQFKLFDRFGGMCDIVTSI